MADLPTIDPLWAYNTPGWTNQGNTGDVESSAGTSVTALAPFGAAINGNIAQNLDNNSVNLTTSAALLATSVFYGSLVYIPSTVLTSKITFDVGTNASYVTHGYGALLSTAGTTVLATADFEAAVTSTGWYSISWATSPAVVAAGLYYLGVAIAWSTQVDLNGAPVAVVTAGNNSGVTPHRFVTGSVTITSSFPASVTLTEQTLLGVPYLAMF